MRMKNHHVTVKIRVVVQVIVVVVEVMTKKSVNSKKVTCLIRDINKSKKIIAAERDKLRNLISEVEEIEFKYEQVINNLNDAVDTLSQLL